MGLTSEQTVAILDGLEDHRRTGRTDRLAAAATPSVVRAMLEDVWRAERDLKLLRQALAYEAGVVRAHYEGYKSFPKSRLDIAVAQAERMAGLAEFLRVSDAFHARYTRMVLPDAAATGVPATIDYTNHAGVRAVRRILPVRLRYGTTPKQNTPRWLVDAIDVERGVDRSFSLHDIHSWQDGV